MCKMMPDTARLNSNEGLCLETVYLKSRAINVGQIGSIRNQDNLPGSNQMLVVMKRNND